MEREPAPAEGPAAEALGGRGGEAGRLAANQQDQGKNDQLSHGEAPGFVGNDDLAALDRDGNAVFRGDSAAGDRDGVRPAENPGDYDLFADGLRQSGERFDGRQAALLGLLAAAARALVVAAGQFLFRMGCSFMSFSRGCFQSRILRVSVSSV